MFDNLEIMLFGNIIAIAASTLMLIGTAAYWDKIEDGIKDILEELRTVNEKLEDKDFNRKE